MAKLNGTVSVGFAKISANPNPGQVNCFFYSQGECKAVSAPHSLLSEPPGNCLAVNLTETLNLRCNDVTDLSNVPCPSTTSSISANNTLIDSPFASLTQLETRRDPRQGSHCNTGMVSDNH